MQSDKEERPGLKKALILRPSRIPNIAIFAIFGVSILTIVWLLLSAMQAERIARQQAESSTLTLRAMRFVDRALSDAETGQRGYFLTGDRAYLTAENLDTRHFVRVADDLRRVLPPDNRHDGSGAEMLRLAEKKMAEINNTVSLADQGRMEEALMVVRNHEGKLLMDRYRTVRDQIDLEERSLLVAASNDARINERRVPWLMMLLILTTLGSLCFGFWLALRTARLEADARNMAALAAAHERTDLLARELNHRVKNLFAIVQSIVRMTARRETDVEVAAEKITDRINALAVAHKVSQGAIDEPVADLRALIEATLAPYQQVGAQLILDGPSVSLPGIKVQPLGLILHELATNAVKYGAWCKDEGTLSIRWTVHGDAPQKVDLVWEEKGVDVVAPGSEGFGTQMMAASARQLGGKISRDFGDKKMRATLSFPLD